MRKTKDKLKKSLVHYNEEFEDNHNEMKAIVLQKYAHQRILHSEIQFGNYTMLKKHTFLVPE